jgi:hypothetical protein
MFKILSHEMNTTVAVGFSSGQLIALLGKWLFKLLTEEGTWQTILKRKYIGPKALSQVL